MKFHFVVKKRRKKMPVTFRECPWQISECRKMPVTSARDIFARDISKTPVTIFKKMPVTSKKWPWQISKIECHAHKKMSRGKKKHWPEMVKNSPKGVQMVVWLSYFFIIPHRRVPLWTTRVGPVGFSALFNLFDYDFIFDLPYVTIEIHPLIPHRRVP